MSSLEDPIDKDHAHEPTYRFGWKSPIVVQARPAHYDKDEDSSGVSCAFHWILLDFAIVTWERSIRRFSSYGVVRSTGVDDSLTSGVNGRGFATRVNTRVNIG
jgi:hypothetical protein